MSKKRPYTLRKRARSQDETRKRIVEATVQLHEELGPRATTISAIAERAGVQRLTVYRHFPDEAAVFQACTSHWLALNPPPDAALWTDRDDGLTRVRTALRAFYDYYEKTERMWVGAYRDEADVPALKQPMDRVRDGLNAVAADLHAHLSKKKKNAALTATLRHALAFETWRSLKAQKLGSKALVETVVKWISAVR